MVDVLEEAHDSAAERCRTLLERRERTEDRHCVIPVLRWAATFFAERGDGPATRACAQALSRVATSTARPEALAALTHTLGEVAWLDGDPGQAAGHFVHALDLLRELDTPLERAETQLRAGVALAAAGMRSAGVEQLAAAYRVARKLGARPLATRIARALAGLGEQVDRRLGRIAEGRLRSGDLTRRQVDILRLVAQGRTNKEIAQELFLSPRTVEMHVGDILASLDCRSRTEAVRRAGELHLL